jgi:hypothetical protein
MLQLALTRGVKEQRGRTLDPRSGRTKIWKSSPLPTKRRRKKPIYSGAFPHPSPVGYLSGEDFREARSPVATYNYYSREESEQGEKKAVRPFQRREIVGVIYPMQENLFFLENLNIHYLLLYTKSNIR